ncbi:winged helix-turn-helix domain-containing protein [Yersinia aleksiciae]|uniref:winged helix-turn-helix domain-containing protein n=1 Tax=Yersinia aleksiciae TaxID=263819 RepID=UPI0011A31246|nr:winged helix-turn-helix domain-containing protein [Yersinia aleksiciae]MDN0124305.1 winged helix-turn-helix domain-containing protein [Yersinia aleksiciae]
MIYTINNEIKFRDDDGIIWLDNDELSNVTLTATTSRLLSFLLNKQGNVVSRDEILAQVWDAHGLRSSNNSLNKYISDLRNMFRNMGCTEEIIITVPRIGFMISDEIDIDREGDTVITEIPSAPTVPVTATEIQKIERNSKKNLVYLAMIIVLALGLTFLFIQGNRNSTEEENSPMMIQKTYPLGEVNGCTILSLKQTTNQTESAKLKLSIAQKIMSSEQFKCLPKSVIYLQISEAVINGFSGRVFLSRCTYSDDKQKQFVACSNFYETDYEIEK